MSALRSGIKNSSSLGLVVKPVWTGGVSGSTAARLSGNLRLFQPKTTIMAATRSLSTQVSPLQSTHPRPSPPTQATVLGNASRKYSQTARRSTPEAALKPGANGYAADIAEATAVAQQPIIHDVYESKTGTWQYIVVDPSTNKAVIIDPALDYDPATQTITFTTADALLSLVREKGYIVDMILETHAHADHLTAASYLQSRLEQEQGDRPFIGIGKRIGQVQKLFGQKYGVPVEEMEGAFDKLFDDDEVFHVGNLEATALHLPGHTPDHLGYKIGDHVFCGDSLLNVDIGTARCDFPGGSAQDLFKSGRRLLSLPDHVKIWNGHDYPSSTRTDPVPYVTVGSHREHNKHLMDGATEDQYVSLRRQRDATMGEPRLLHQSLQINIRGGRLPEPTESGQRFVHLPLKMLVEEW
ncbi:uncharacterized protein A1O9_11084 [Exophiala aquamarina CBS 119918]|uniref:Metallo-beta-lactamase domain-containing protein n=1 Tax=Exophiala aquamarina CBS 119918 TaxID=1182545 RepID=A0A072NZ20_9EURO|nr:uncharacterized protein A1O9_11084 [Exophiala aquamarina CBS 119918]KEF52667.1 hypothetical protein A1O9_11084 [Exophiala aquamarina CBS 119918]